jgi:hypothetical protein
MGPMELRESTLSYEGCMEVFVFQPCSIMERRGKGMSYLYVELIV